MNTTLIVNCLTTIANLLLPDNTFVRVKAAVERWETKELLGAEKHQGVLHELETIGIQLAAWLANLVIELAVAALRVEQGASTTKQTGA